MVKVTVKLIVKTTIKLQVMVNLIVKARVKLKLMVKLFVKAAVKLKTLGKATVKAIVQLKVLVKVAVNVRLKVLRKVNGKRKASSLSDTAFGCEGVYVCCTTTLQRRVPSSPPARFHSQNNPHKL